MGYRAQIQAPVCSVQDEYYTGCKANRPEREVGVNHVYDRFQRQLDGVVVNGLESLLRVCEFCFDEGKRGHDRIFK